MSGGAVPMGGVGGNATYPFFLSRMDKMFFDNFFLNLKNVHIYMRNAEYAETNEKLIFVDLVFKLWSFLYSKLVNFSMNFEYKIDHDSKN